MSAAATRVAEADVAAAGVPAIDLEHVSRWFGNVVAVNDITFSVGPGVTGLLGPNGAGKSTLLHMISGFLRPSAGAVRIMGAAPSGDPAVYRQVGLVPEREAVYPFLSGREFVLLSARLHKLPDPEGAADRALAAVEMTDVAARATGGYSKGMKQRIKVAAAIVHDPPVLILDEPFNGMDPRQRLHMMDLLRTKAAEGRVVLFSSHILEEVERLAESVLVVVGGRLAASGDFREIRRLMTDRPHTFRVRSSDNRRLASVLVANPGVVGIDLASDALNVRVVDFDGFTHRIAGAARGAAVSLLEIVPSDESLETVFSYLVHR